MRNLTNYIENYTEHPFEDIQVAYRKRNVLDLLKKYNHKNILEVGCGLDPFFNSYRDFDKLVIVEPSAIFYKNALDIVNNDNDLAYKVLVINRYLEDSINELQEHSFDFVIISCLIHEIENVSSFLEKLHCFINRNTIVHIDVPNAYSFHRVLAHEMGLIESVFEMSPSNLRLQQKRVFDMASLSDLILKHKFEIIDSGTYFLKPFTHNQMSKMLETNIIDKKALDGFYKMTKYMPDLGSEIFIES